MRIIKLLLVMTIITVSGVYVFTRKITRIECFSQFGPCTGEILNSYQSLVGQSLFGKFHMSQLSGLTGKPEFIKSVAYHRRLPGTLIINLTYRQPIVRVTSDNSEIQSAADSDGMVLASTSFSALPYLNTSKKYLSGEILDPNTLKAAQIIKTLSLSFNNLPQNSFSDPLLKTRVGETQVLFDINFLPANWPETLQNILQGSKINAKVPKIVDLRFSQPVLTY